MRLQGKRILVTGSSRGIGRAIALHLAGEGARVAVHYRRERARAEEAVAEIGRAGGQAFCVQGDVRDDAAVVRMVAEAAAAFGGLDVLVNNAGIEYEEAPEEVQEAHWDEVFAVNVKGVFFCCRAAAVHLRQGRALRPGEPWQPGASPAAGLPPAAIVNISSRYSFLGDPDSPGYSASKAALNNLTKAFAKRYAPAIRVNGVAPAYTPTDMMAHASEEYRSAFRRNTPLQRDTQPQDTAAAVAFLASDEASFTTGTTLLVDGGYALK